MEELRKFLSFHKGERVAIVTLMVLIFLLVLAVVFHRPRVSLDSAALHNLDSLLALRQAAIEEMQADSSTGLHPFPFNPNTLTEEEGRALGMTERQVNNLIRYREKGGRFYAKSDFARLYAISEEDYAKLESFILLPDVSPRRVRTKQHEAKETTEYVPKEIPVVDLNSVDSVNLVELPQIGPYTAMRIVEYRNKLGGYVDIEQLRELKSVDSSRFAVFSPYLRIVDPQPSKIDVNRSDFTTLVRHPYLTYEQVCLIFNQREKRGMIKNWAQLEALLKDEGELNPLLEYYVNY